MEHHPEESSTFRVGSSTHHFLSYSIEEKSVTWPHIISKESKEYRQALVQEAEEISFLIS